MNEDLKQQVITDYGDSNMLQPFKDSRFFITYSSLSETGVTIGHQDAIEIRRWGESVALIIVCLLTYFKVFF